MIRSILVAVFAAFVVIGSGLLAPTQSYAANACPAGQVPDALGNCCPPQALGSGPGGGSLCPGSTITPGGIPLRGRTASGYLVGWRDPPDSSHFSDVDDPYFSDSSTRVNQVTTTSAATGAQGLAPGAQITTLGTGADGHINASNFFDLKGSNQRLTIGAYFDYSSIRGTFDDLAPGAWFQRNMYSAGATASYSYNRSYINVEFGGLWGDGKETDSTGAVGNFNSSGYQGSITAGHVFPLYDTRTFSSRQLVVKAVPANPTPTGGYFVGLDLSGTVETYHETIGSFTDSSGFINGAENLTTWTVTGRAKLYADILNNGLVWTPYATLGVSQQVDYSHTLALVAQAGQAADTLQFAAPGQTFGIFQTGVSVLDAKGIRYGIDGSYARSSGVESIGGRAYVRVPLLRWLGISG
jgi:hypothetical protein